MMWIDLLVVLSTARFEDNPSEIQRRVAQDLSGKDILNMCRG